MLGVNDDDKIGMSVDDEEKEEEVEVEVAAKEPSDSEKKTTSPKPDKATKMKKNKRKHKKHKSKEEKDVLEPEAGPSAEEIYEAKKRRRRERLEAQTETVKERPSEDLEDKVILNESTVYSMGNYCATMLAGLKCREPSCSWSHVMLANDAAAQFSKILQFR